MALLIWMLLGIVWLLQVIKLARPIRPEELSERARRRLGYDDAEAVPGNKPTIRRGAGRMARVRTSSPPQGSRRPAA